MSHLNQIEDKDADPPLLHIYGQGAWHDTAYLVGNRKALTELRDAIDRVLANGGWDAAHVFSDDGEGYAVAIHRYDVTWDNFDLVNHYAEGDITGGYDEGDKPWQMYAKWLKSQPGERSER